MRLDRSAKRHGKRGKAKYINADVLEGAVMDAPAEFLSSPVKFQKAVYGGQDKEARRKQLQREIRDLSMAKADYRANIERVVDKIADGIISDADARKKVSQYKEAIRKCEEALEAKTAEISGLPSPAHLEAVRQSVMGKFQRSKMASKKSKAKFRKDLFALSFEEKVDLIRKLFTGLDPDGRRCGIYVDLLETGDYRLRLHGSLGFWGLWEIDQEGNQITYDEDGNVVTVEKPGRKGGRVKSNVTKKYGNPSTDQRGC